MRLAETFRQSVIGRALLTLRRWAGTSTVVAVLASERVLATALAGFVVLSVVSVFASNLGAGVKFLSFLLTFVVVAALTYRVLDPPAE